MSIYVAQTKLRLQADTGLSATDFAAITSSIIKYEKPDGTVSSFSATEGTAPYIYYDIASASDLDVAGIWFFWSYVTFTGGLVAPGDPWQQSVLDEIT